MPEALVLARSDIAVVDPVSSTRPSAIARAGNDLTFSLVSDPRRLEDLRHDWLELFEHSAQPHNVFQSFTFVRLWCSAWLSPTDSRQQLAVVTGYRAGRLVMVFPLVLERWLGLKILTWLGQPMAQYGDVLIDAAADQHADILQQAWTFIGKMLAPDLARLDKVRADATVMPLLEALGSRPTRLCEAASVSLAAGGDGTSFESRQSGKAKKNRRRLLRRLDEKGTTAFVAPKGRGALLFLDAALAQKREWLRARGLASTAFAGSRLDRFLEEAAASSGAKDMELAVYALVHEDRPVALAVGFRAKERLTLYMITYAAGHEKSGVGVLNLENVLRVAEADGLRAVDLLAPIADYKMDWADDVVSVTDHALALSTKGHAIGLSFERFVKPAARAVFAALPLGCRKLLADAR